MTQLYRHTVEGSLCWCEQWAGNRTFFFSQGTIDPHYKQYRLPYSSQTQGGLNLGDWLAKRDSDGIASIWSAVGFREKFRREDSKDAIDLRVAKVSTGHDWQYDVPAGATLRIRPRSA